MTVMAIRASAARRVGAVAAVVTVLIGLSYLRLRHVNAAAEADGPAGAAALALSGRS